MTTDADVRDQAVAFLQRTTDSYPSWVRKGRPVSSNWAKAFATLALIPVAAPDPPPTSTNPVPPPPTGVYFGAYIECVETYGHYRPDLGPWTENVPWSKKGWALFEQDAGKKIAMLMTGGGNFWNGSYGDLQYILAANSDAGTIPVIDCDTSQMGTLADVAAGRYDPNIDAAAAQFKAFGKPLVLRIDAEMNGGWYAYGKEIRASAAGPATFVAAWQRIVTRFRAAGATNVAYHWCPNVDPEHIQTPIGPLYPGDLYVDYTGMTGYAHSAAETVSWIFGDTYAQVAAIAPRKPMMIGETASIDVSPTTGAKARFIQDFSAWLLSAPLVRAFCWFNWYITENGQVWDWPIESSPASLAAFKSMVASPTIVGRP